MFNNYPDILVTMQVCEALSLGKNTVYSLLKNGELHSIRVRGQYRIPKKSLIEFVSK